MPLAVSHMVPRPWLVGRAQQCWVDGVLPSAGAVAREAGEHGACTFTGPVASATGRRRTPLATSSTSSRRQRRRRTLDLRSIPGKELLHDGLDECWVERLGVLEEVPEEQCPHELRDGDVRSDRDG